MANMGLVNAFNEMAEFEFSIGSDTFKGDAYRKVANALSLITVPIRSGKALANGKEKVAGIGKASGEKIDEFLSTGKIQRKTSPTGSRSVARTRWRTARRPSRRGLRTRSRRGVATA